VIFGLAKISPHSSKEHQQQEQVAGVLVGSTRIAPRPWSCGYMAKADWSIPGLYWYA